MPRNVEIKAKITTNIDEFERNVIRLCCCSASSTIVLQQVDTFFIVPNGRLKLRQFIDDDTSKAQLIFYNRANTTGPKLCDFHRTIVDENAESLKHTLSLALGITGEVRKTRRLYIYREQTRIHIDNVHGLGHFVELEVCLRDDQTPNEGESIANEIMTKLSINADDLVSCAYMDLILNC